MRNVLAKVPRRSNTQMVIAAIHTIFAQPDAADVRAQLERITATLERPVPRRRRHALRRGQGGLLAFSAFPESHWRKIWSTNPLERVNGEIKRRTNVVGIFPNDAAVARLVTAVLVETHDEWEVRRTALPLGDLDGPAAAAECDSRRKGAEDQETPRQLSHPGGREGCL